MSARTYSTDVYLTYPAPDCEGRKVPHHVRKFRSRSLRASRAPAGVRRAPTGNSTAKPGGSNRSANTQRLDCQ
jgi:hypothetical protein